MASYLPPSENPPIFNPPNWQSGSDGLTLSEADGRYLQLSGGTERGLVFFNAGLDTASITNSGNTFTVPSTSGQLALVSQIPTSADYVDRTTAQSVGGAKTFTTGILGNYLGSNPWTAPGYAFTGFSNAGLYFATDGTNYRTVGVAVNGIYRFTTGYNLISGATFHSFYNSDNTYLGGFQTTAATGAGIFQIGSATNQINLSYTGASNVNVTLPVAAGRILASTGAYPTVASQGLTLKDAQTISVSTYLAGTSLNLDSTTYTDSATAASGTVAQVSDVVLGQRTFNASNTGVTYTAAASLQVKGPPVAGTNVTMTTRNAVQVDSGNVTLTSGQVISTSAGTAANPSFAVSGGTGLGMYSSAANTLSFSVSSGSRLNLTGGGMSPQVVIRNVTGSAAAPSYAYSIDAASGMYIVAASNVALAVAGTKLMDYTATKTSVVVAGSAASPSFGFSTDTGTGLYRPSADQIGVSSSGVNIGTWSSTGLNVVGKTTTGTFQSGSNGTTFGTSIQFGSFTTSAVITVGSNADIGTITTTGFGSTPKILLTMSCPSSGGTQNWDRCILSIDAGASSTNSNHVLAFNTSGLSTSGTATVYWMAYA